MRFRKVSHAQWALVCWVSIAYLFVVEDDHLDKEMSI
jgi:hypothetical protein